MTPIIHALDVDAFACEVIGAAGEGAGADGAGAWGASAGVGGGSGGGEDWPSVRTTVCVALGRGSWRVRIRMLVSSAIGRRHRITNQIVEDQLQLISTAVQCGSAASILSCLDWLPTCLWIGKTYGATDFSWALLLRKD